MLSVLIYGTDDKRRGNPNVAKVQQAQRKACQYVAKAQMVFRKASGVKGECHPNGASENNQETSLWQASHATR